ncbi:hypothetical protein PFICI_01592 [Pestalotiopsis fici W106-1]|uniref:Uncharacterized protein n=1 Tax=Pestalotiopsis fici (strain W106-1 / CGMCC3.15140) TaxID=1229662 RepID=W3XP68_PESFW|nr:uncharacterized protein PFICI_01592 [Pestalotiopsis fici W106-1]ETS87764.1 hypothetical protein PFICI_01592 [Pestalotiopsis fici W106-1]
MIKDEKVQQSLIDSVKELLVTARKHSVPIIDCLIDTSIDPPPTSKICAKSLILGVIATSGAVISTAMQAIDEGFVVTVVRDAIWDPDEQVNRILLYVLLPGSGYVVSTADAVGFMQNTYKF